jgi:hypothetical protein
MDPFKYALAFLAIAVAIAVFLYFRPRFANTEGFATLALDDKTMPKCILRNADAQALLAMLASYDTPTREYSAAYDEFKLILSKLTCIDADITGMGAGVYSTFNLPFATSHDTEPAAEFVGRCVRNAVRSRDIELVMDKFERRGIELLNDLCSDADKEAAVQRYRSVLMTVQRNITQRCLSEKNTMDKPASPRDPGYFSPPCLQSLSPYTIVGGGKQYI